MRRYYKEQRDKEKLSENFKQVKNDLKVATDVLEDAEVQGNDGGDSKLPVEPSYFTHLGIPTGQQMETYPVTVEVGGRNRKLFRMRKEFITNTKLERLVRKGKVNSDESKVRFITTRDCSDDRSVLE